MEEKNSDYERFWIVVPTSPLKGDQIHNRDTENAALNLASELAGKSPGREYCVAEAVRSVKHTCVQWRDHR